MKITNDNVQHIDQIKQTTKFLENLSEFGEVSKCTYYNGDFYRIKFDIFGPHELSSVTELFHRHSLIYYVARTDLNSITLEFELCVG